jgi:hypothetical protein
MSDTILKQRGKKTIIEETKTEIKTEPEPEPPIQTSTIIDTTSEPNVKVKKPRKPKTEKQMESFKLIAAKRQENIIQKKIAKKIEASKYLLEHDELPYKAKLRAKATPKQISIESDDSSSDDSQPKIIIKKIHKKKKKPVIIHVEESSSDEESSDEEPIKTPPTKPAPIQPPPQPVKQFISQQNKKSLIQMVPFKNYFVE